MPGSFAAPLSTSVVKGLPQSPGPCGGATFDTNILKDVYTTIVAENPNDFEYIDIWERCLGSGNAPNSDPEFFADVIHLNKRGYCQVFSYDKLQTAFGCSAATYDCCSQPQTSCKAPEWNGNFPCRIGSYTPGASTGGEGASNLVIVAVVVGAVVLIGAVGALTMSMRSGRARGDDLNEAV